MQDSDDSNEHQQQSPPRPKTSKKLTGAATYRTKFSSIWVSHYRVLFEVERSVHVCGPHQVWPLRSECCGRGVPTKVVCAECMKMCCLGGKNSVVKGLNAGGGSA